MLALQPFNHRLDLSDVRLHEIHTLADILGDKY